ncbi:MAG: nucleoside deaminase [Planctomycetales bacterium]|nr:nucleoside deaminase [bacterium]UNM10026.1 MAG: nucleoside deaminase [Planctomycetales bacterium]
MQQALEQARLALDAGEVPVGSVVVHRGEVIGRGHNRTRMDASVTAHAELVAMREAASHIGDFRLDPAEIYITLEPCLMCLGAIHQARISRVVYGAREPKFGALGSVFDMQGHNALRKLEFSGGLLEEESRQLMQQFFSRLRGGGCSA